MTIKFSPDGVIYINQSTTTWRQHTQSQTIYHYHYYHDIGNAILKLDPPNIFQVLGHPQNLKYNIHKKKAKLGEYKIFISTNCA